MTFVLELATTIATAMEYSDLQVKRRKVGCSATISSDESDYSLTPAMRTRSASLLGINESDMVSSLAFAPGPPADADESRIEDSLSYDDNTPSCSAFTPKTSSHDQLSQALQEFEAAYPGCRSDCFGDTTFQNDVRSLGQKLIQCITHDAH